MASDTDIANRALQKLGEARIASLDDNIKAARAVKACFDILRDNELRAHRWNFSIKRTQLAALADAPLFGFSLQYQLPEDCLKVVNVGNIRQSIGLMDYRSGMEALYKIEGRRILTSLGAPLSLIYVARITDAAQFDANFIESLACKIAIETCEELTQSSSKKQNLMVDYRRAVREALLSDAIEDPPEGLADDSWTLARL